MGAEVESVARVNAALSMMIIFYDKYYDDEGICRWRIVSIGDPEEVTRCAHTDLHRPNRIVLSIKII